VAGRHVALSVGAVLVLALGVYLLMAVRAQPAPPAIVTAPAAPRHYDQAPPTEAPASAPAAPGAARPQPVDPEANPPDPAVSPVLGGSAAFGMSKDELEHGMVEANHAYDRGDYEEARTLAGQVLIHQPSNARMLRILVSSSCIEGDAPAAQAAYAQLPAPDQEQMRTRCTRYGITLPLKP
jgi:hypothetical protein